MLLGVDKICPELLKALDIVGLYCLKRLYSFVWSVTVYVEWKTSSPIIGVPHCSASLEQQCRFCPGCGIVDQLFIVYWQAYGSLLIHSTCVLWIWRRITIYNNIYNMCPPGSLGGGSLGVSGTRAVTTSHPVLI